MWTRRASWVFGLSDVGTAGLILFGVFVGLPARVAAVDATAVILALIQVASGALLLAAAMAPPRAEAGGASAIALRVATLAAAVMLAVGLVLVTALALTASWLSGVYGPVGLGGAAILALVAALALPYLVVLPAVKLVWCTR